VARQGGRRVAEDNTGLGAEPGPSNRGVRGHRSGISSVTGCDACLCAFRADICAVSGLDMVEGCRLEAIVETTGNARSTACYRPALGDIYACSLRLYSGRKGRQNFDVVDAVRS
jgi:hypothetical protein